MGALAIFVLVLVVLLVAVDVVAHHLALLLTALAVTVAVLAAWRLIVARNSRPVIHLHRRYVADSMNDAAAVRRARRRQHQLDRSGARNLDRWPR